MNATNGDTGREHGDRKLWLYLTAVLLCCALVRVRLLSVPLERDEGEYAYGGQLLLAGLPPFAGLYNMKLPGVSIVYAGSMLVFGETIRGARLSLLAANLATIALVYALARRLRFSGAGAVFAAAAFGVLSLSTEMLGPFGHATHFVSAAGTAGLLLLLIAVERRSLVLFFASGSLFGIGVLMKQPGVVYAAAGLWWVLLHRDGRDRGEVLRGAALLVLGIAAPLALLGVWLAAAGTLHEAWFWIVDYGRAYGGRLSLREGVRNLALVVSRFVPEALLFWALAIVGLAACVFRAPLRPRARRLLPLAAFSFVGVCPGFYFREHYFLLALPAAALLAATGAEEIAGRYRAAVPITVAMAALAAAQALVAQRQVLLQLAPEQVSRAIYGADLFVESLAIADRIRGQTRPQDRVLVLGSEPQVYFYARRRSATGFIYMYPLMEPQPYAPAMQRRLIQECEERAPAYVVVFRSPTSWLVRDDSDPTILRWFPRFLSRDYELDGQVISSERGSDFHWGADARARPISLATQALLFRRTR